VSLCPKCTYDNPPSAIRCERCDTWLLSSSQGATRPGLPPDGEHLYKPGDVIAGRYAVLEIIGRGGVGCIYKVHDTILEETVVLKILLPSFVSDKSMVDRFLNEARIARKLTHPHIVRIHDVGRVEQTVFISMELIEGRSLRELLDQLKPGDRPPLQDALRIVDELCSALEYAHQFTVHRDIKPENIMLNKGGRVKLMDFGISKLKGATQYTSIATVMGTPYYMSPEQLRDSHDVDQRADIFSTGVVLYELLTGYRPTGIPKPASEMSRDVPPLMDTIISHCVEPDRDRRFQNATEVRTAIFPILQVLREGKDPMFVFGARPGAASASPAGGAALHGPLQTPPRPAPGPQHTPPQAASGPQHTPPRPVTVPESHLPSPAPDSAAKHDSKEKAPNGKKKPDSLPQLDPALREVALASFDSPSIRMSHSKKKKKRREKVGPGKVMLAACMVVAALLMTYWSGNYVVARFNEIRKPAQQKVSVRTNPAEAMLARKDPPLQVLQTALAFDKEEQTPESGETLARARAYFIQDATNRLNVVPFSSKAMNAVSAEVAQVALMDLHPDIQNFRHHVDGELSYHKFMLKSAEEGKSASFILNNSRIPDSEQTVSEGDLLQGRFLVKKIGPRHVSLEDTQVKSPSGTPRPLIARLMSPVE